MPKRAKAKSEEKPPAEERVEELLMEGRRTRSGRTVRPSTALLDSKTPVKTPSRRTRRSVRQDLPPPVEEEIPEDTEQKSPLLTVEEPDVPREPEPTECTEPTEPSEPQPAQTTAVEPESPEGGEHRLPSPVPVETAPQGSDSIPKKKPRLAPNTKQIPVVPLGKPKSGRVWKERNKQRFSALLRDKPLCSSWEKKMQAKREKDLVKQFTAKLKEEKAQKMEEKRKRREENLKRRAENERKAEIVQVIRNTAKIKRMKKKQLRKVEKRDTLALLQKSQKQNMPSKVKKDVKQDLT
ncbi:PREDICTED: coiled-coil domain-containing protein 86-like [Cyprinodon variegatus]|uniref:Coiled-coil domain-containing protein 86 n=1 Tax=Cyprinodon variegatus TaxID=28743 RepID=A0A3Q2DQY5_CYPVA|nr:PREDICTED: coiled-coil domain-containing protein 86-like [Cyprinodon variegatus]